MPRRRKDIVQLLDQATAQRTPVLDLSRCDLRDLVDRICEMDWLVELDLSHCHLSTLPEAIGNLAVLTRLSLAENQLTTLPDGMLRLTALQHLDLRAAGFELTFSDYLKPFLESLPETIWIDGKPPNFIPDPPPRAFPEHPNELLAWLKSALTLYGDALSMEDRGFGGSRKRAEANALIGEIMEIPEMPGLFPEFFRDFQAHRFYSTSRESEKSLDQNPFRLPTGADDNWLAANPAAANPPPLRLEAFVDGRREILVVNRQTGVKSEVTSCQHGGQCEGYQPYEKDVHYWADSAAWLHQAGSGRFYVRVNRFGESIYSSDEWYGSSDGGASWQQQPKLTYPWLNKNYSCWHELGRLETTKSREEIDAARS